MTSRAPGHPIRAAAASLLAVAVEHGGDAAARLAVSAGAMRAALELLRRPPGSRQLHGLELCAALDVIVALFHSDGHLARGFGERGSTVSRCLKTVLPDLLFSREF
jgi:hypothetical protein